MEIIYIFLAAFTVMVASLSGVLFLWKTRKDMDRKESEALGNFCSRNIPSCFVRTL